MKKESAGQTKKEKGTSRQQPADDVAPVGQPACACPYAGGPYHAQSRALFQEVTVNNISVSTSPACIHAQVIL